MKIPLSKYPLILTAFVVLLAFVFALYWLFHESHLSKTIEALLIGAIIFIGALSQIAIVATIAAVIGAKKNR